MVLPMIFSLDSISQTKFNICLLKINNPNQLILHCTIEYHPWYLEDIIPLHYILRILMKQCLPPVINISWFWVVMNREHRLPFLPPPILFGDVAIRLHSLEISRHKVSWSSSTFYLPPCVY